MMKFMRIRSFSSPSAPLKYPIGQPTSLGYNQVSENPDLKSTKKRLKTQALGVIHDKMAAKSL